MSLSSISPDQPGSLSRTRIIAHRGASGYLPEHTAVAKTLAYGFGADFIEQDVVATKDHDLVVLHDITLDDVSDVATIFPGRRREDGHFYVADFTTVELQQLTLHERLEPGSENMRFPQRFPYRLPTFRIMRFEDEVRLIAGLNAATGRHVGIYPEIKDPAWHASNDIDLTGLIHTALESLRSEISGPVFVQSFDRASLVRMRDEFGTDWPLVQLLDRADASALTGNPGAISATADYASGVGLPYTELLDRRGDGIEATELAAQLAAADLLVHPYTLRRDAPDTEKGIDYFDALRALILDLQVDAVFCDQPDDALLVRNRTAV
jgi:glycerophosphoryl diester phosphodiesterase